MNSTVNPRSSGSECSEVQTSTAIHSKHLSSMSTTTVQTTTTLVHETPYEPLLPPITQNSRESSRHSPIRTLPRWPNSRPASTLNEFGTKKSFSTHSPSPSRTNARKLWWSRRLLETIMIIWSLYCTGRYLTSFILYNDLTSQLVSLGLGTSTGLSFAFTCCSLALSLVQTRLLFHGLSTTALLSLRATLQYLSSLFFLTPSITNLILLIVWRNSQMPSVQITHRCKLDVDLVWSAISSCNHPLHSWGTWISLAVLRFALSLCIVSTFHRIASAQVIFLANPPSIKAKQSHKRLHSEVETLHSRGGSVVVPRLDRESPTLFSSGNTPHTTEFTNLPNKSSSRNRLRANRSRSYTRVNTDDTVVDQNPDFVPMNSLAPSHSNRSLGGTFMERFRTLISQIATETEQGLAMARSDSASASSLLSHDEATVSPSTSLPELDEKSTSQFQPQYSDHPQYDTIMDEDDFFSTTNSAFPNISQMHPESYLFDQQQYSQEQHVPILNSFIHKMPTIDSMGSRERDLLSLGTGGRNSLAASSLGTPQMRHSQLNTPNSTAPRSRSPIKASPGTWNDAGDLSMDVADALGTVEILGGSERRMSLTAQAELLAGLTGSEGTSTKGVNEVGELPRGGETIRMIGGGSSGAAGDNYALDSLRNKLGGFDQDLDLAFGFGFGSGTSISTDYDSSTSASKESKESAGSLQTFHTAKSNRINN